MDSEQLNTAVGSSAKMDTLTSASSFERELVLQYSDSASSHSSKDDDELPLPVDTLNVESTQESKNLGSEHNEEGQILVTQSTEASPGIESELTMEYLMTEQEIAQWDKRLQECTDRLKVQIEEHTKWESNLTSRRQLVSTRVKKLQEHYHNRRQLYACVEEYLKHANPDMSANTTTNT